jgi:hypothetical protein
VELALLPPLPSPASPEVPPLAALPPVELGASSVSSSSLHPEIAATTNAGSRTKSLKDDGRQSDAFTRTSWHAPEACDVREATE